MSVEDEEVVYSGRVKFKAGLINRWSTVFCTLCEGLLRVHESPDSSADPIHCFMSSSSWISAKRAQANTLFVLNETDPNSVGSKIFLFDTESADLLHLWLHGFKRAGWSSAITGEKLNYRAHNNSGPNKAYRESGFGGSLRGTRSQSEPTFFVTGRPKMGGDDIDLDNSYRWIGSRRRRANLTSVFSDIDISTESYAEEVSNQTRMGLNMKSYETEINDLINTGEETESSSSTYLRDSRNVDKSSKRGASGKGRRENRETANESRRFGPLSKEEEVVNAYDMHVNFVNRNNNVNIENATGSRRPEVSKHHSEPNISKSYLRPSRQGRFDYSRIFFDPTLSPDMKGKLMEAESRTRKTSVTRKGEHIRLSESDEHDIAEQAAGSSYRNTEKNESAATLEVTNVDTGEKEALNDNLRQRKCSSVASDGIADLNVDVDGDSSVFHPGTQGSPMSYLESGYCSKESLSTNESLDQRKLSVSNIDEINNNNDEKTELENEAEVCSCNHFLQKFNILEFNCEKAVAQESFEISGIGGRGEGEVGERGGGEKRGWGRRGGREGEVGEKESWRRGEDGGEGEVGEERWGEGEVGRRRGGEKGRWGKRREGGRGRVEEEEGERRGKNEKVNGNKTGRGES